eukprot:365567-Chlamydomonas_euryale.AAC.7
MAPRLKAQVTSGVSRGGGAQQDGASRAWSLPPRLCCVRQVSALGDVSPYFAAAGGISALRVGGTHGALPCTCTCLGRDTGTGTGTQTQAQTQAQAQAASAHSA